MLYYQIDMLYNRLSSFY